MKKYLDILLFTLLFFLMFSYFTGDDAQTQLNGVVFETTKSTYKVPAEVGLQIINNTNEVVALNTCNDISLRFSGNIVDIPEELCSETELASRESKTLDFAAYHTLFDTP